jgi:uncharacterized protein YjiS (DUF1127 family)
MSHHHRRITLRRLHGLNLSTTGRPVSPPNPFLLALRRLLHGVFVRRRCANVGVLRLESLNAHALRDIGLTHHVERD